MMMNAGRLAMGSLLACFATLGGAAEQPETPRLENQVIFSTDSNPVSPEIVRMRERLRDPQQRQALRAEHRASIQQRNVDLAQVLEIEPGIANRLMDLLADQELQHLDDFHAERGPRYVGRSPQEHADAETERLDALRQLLGQAKLERYQDYALTVAERGQVAKMEARLGAADKLQRDPKERLVAMLRERTLNEIEGRSFLRLPAPLASVPNTPFSADALRRNSRLQTIELNEGIWRDRLQSNRLLEQRAAEFLSPAQLTAFQQMNAADTEATRQWIIQAREHSGLDPKIPEAPAATMQEQAAGIPVAGNLKIEISLAVNRDAPTIHTHTGVNGEPFTLQGTQGLLVEVTPTLYTHDYLDVRMVYFEQGARGKRRLPGSSGQGITLRLPDGSPNPGSGHGVSIVSGTKGYAITTYIKVMSM